jgi:hypothetical protein
MSSRPRAFVVGEEALVRRCWGRRRAAALVVAEHPLPSLLWGCACSLAECLAAPGAAPPALSWLLDERCDGSHAPCAHGAGSTVLPCQCGCPSLGSR